MGMEHNNSKRRRRVRVNPGEWVQISIRLKPETRRLVKALQQPGRLDPGGCSMGDVLEVAIYEDARTHS